MKKKTTEEFIELSKAIHGDRYDYSKTEYKDIKTKICITCQKHGDFYLIPDNHLRKGYGCPKCGRIKLGQNSSYTWGLFLLKAREIHGYKYDYSLAKEQYKNEESVLTIICPIHGKFNLTGRGHLRGGCKLCGIKSSADKKRLSTELFIENAQKIHGDKYDYSEVNYYNSITPVKIICKEHGYFLLLPNVHTSLRCGCPNCKHQSIVRRTIKKRIGTPEFINKAKIVHGDKYDYSLTEYIRKEVPVKIICPIHGEFLQRPDNHLSGKGCPECGKQRISLKLSKSLEQFLEDATQIHGDKYDYSKAVYVDSWTPVTIICPIHGEFYQKPVHHIHQGNGCPKCTLKSQTKVFEKLCESFPGENILFEVGRRVVKWLNGQRLDIYFPDYNIAVEYDGLLHFVPIEHFGGALELKKRQVLDKTKEDLCLKNSCRLFRLRYDYSEEDFNDLVSQIKEIINK